MAIFRPKFVRKSVALRMKSMTLAERALARVKQLVDEHGFSHEALAPHMGVGPSAVSKILSGTNALGLDHIEGICIALQITPAELLLEPGALIQPLSPIEAAVLALFRQMTELERHSLLVVLQSRRPTYIKGQGRKARLGRAELSAKEQELVDLFAKVKRDGVREGVLKTLRGAAKDDEATAPAKSHRSE